MLSAAPPLFDPMGELYGIPNIVSTGIRNLFPRAIGALVRRAGWGGRVLRPARQASAVYGVIADLLNDIVLHWRSIQAPLLLGLDAV
jgi:hypothetical protein